MIDAGLWRIYLYRQKTDQQANLHVLHESTDQLSLIGGRCFSGCAVARPISCFTLTSWTDSGQSRSASVVHCILAYAARQTIELLARHQCRSKRSDTHMQAHSGREVLICQKLLELRASADLIRLDTMLRSLFFWRKDFCDLAVPPFADVVVLGFHTVHPALNLVAVVLNQEDGAIQILSYDSRQLLSCELE